MCQNYLIFILFQCKQTFENILCVQTTALLKKLTLEKILKILQEFMCKISDNDVSATEVIHYENFSTETYASTYMVKRGMKWHS